jgi:1,4-dihydroxy-2-naphthoate octaprenyltransferase
MCGQEGPNDWIHRRPTEADLIVRTAEPSIAALRHPLRRYFAATRPLFLFASLVPALLGLAVARHDGVTLALGPALASVLGALLAHAGVNALNDYYDALSGADARNRERLYPYTGGSRLIQNRVLTAAQMARFGAGLLAIAAAIGLWLALYAGPALIALGAFGLLLGWGYSAPPLRLAARGLGEISVALGFGLLIPLGADLVQRQALAWPALLAGLPYALLVANLLYINQFPDRRADRTSGKHHWVVRLGARRARWGYLIMALAAYALLAIEIQTGVLPAAAWSALLPLAASLGAAGMLLRDAERPGRLAPAIRLTVVAMLAHGLLLAAALVWTAP